MPRQPAAFWGRAKRTIGHPITGLLIAIVLSVDIYLLPEPRPWGRGGSTIRAVFTPWFTGCVLYSHLDLVATKTDQGWDVIDDLTSRDEVWDLRGSSTVQHVECSLFGGRRTSRAGLWAPILETNLYELNLKAHGGLTLRDVQAARLAICTHLRSLAVETGDQYYADLANNASVGDTTVRKVLWSGVGHTVLAFALLGGLVYSWQSAPMRLYRIGVERNRRGRARQGLCPMCCYDMTGLEGMAICPECGAVRDCAECEGAARETAEAAGDQAGNA